MMTRNGGKNRDQIEFTSPDELVPEDHLVRKLENAIDWSFIYEMVEDSYCEDNGNQIKCRKKFKHIRLLNSIGNQHAETRIFICQGKQNQKKKQRILMMIFRCLYGIVKL